MRAGEMVGNYRLLDDFRVVGAGLSEWTFAEREGREFFIKRFLSPTYPDDDAPGSPATKARKRAACARFEAHHRGIQAALAPVTRYGGNLITTLDFFRVGAKYYKVTEKVDPAGLSAADVAALTYSTKLVLLKTVAHSLKILHDLEIVHSDLKPSNVLIKRTELGLTTKLIDFDSSYLVAAPPPPEEIVGTMNYYSPELVRYIQGADNGAELTAASDIFALGLIYAEYLTGALPTFDPAHREAAIAVLNGSTLRLPPGSAPTALADMVEQMLSADPAGRPDIGHVHATLMALPSAESATVGRALRPPVAPGKPAVASGLRGRGLRIAGAPGARTGTPVVTRPSPSAPSGPVAPPRSTPDEPAAPEYPIGSGPGTVSTLLGKLLSRLEKGRDR
jgi:serine/threonine protein kinase